MQFSRALLLVFSILGRREANALFQCPICGIGGALTNPAGIVQVPSQPNRTCAETLSLSESGQINETECLFVRESCECRNVTSAPTISTPPSGAPSPEPTFGPPPDCFSDLDNLATRERAVEDVSVPRTLILCPDTNYLMGRIDQDGDSGSGYVGGFDPIVPRPNAHYKCGESGSSSNNCRIVDGDFPIVSFGGDAEHTNITFQGFAIESSFRGGMLLVRPGDLTFVDCIFRNHENFGAVVILYNPDMRRLREPASTGDDKTDLIEFLYMISRDGINDNIDETDEEVVDRQLPEEQNPDFLTLTVTFRQTVFEGNKPTPPTQFTRPGIVSAESPETILVFEDVTFLNNDFGDRSIQPSTWAIKTSGPLSIKNCCFLNNTFLRQAPVLTFGFPKIEASNNFGGPLDEDLACQFIAEFQDLKSYEALVDYTCIDYDAVTCQAQPHETSPPKPTRAPVMPTRQPIERPALVPEPSAKPTLAKDSADSVSFLLWMLSVAFIGAAVMV